MKIKDLKVGMSNVSIKAKVAKLSEPREIMTRFGTATTLTEAMLEDDSGSIKMTLWGKQSEGIEEGKEIEVTGGFVKEFRDELQIGIRKGGEIKVTG